MKNAMNELKNDSSVDDIQNQIFSKMSFSEKWKAALQLREVAWAMKAAGVRSFHPDWSEQQVQEAVKKIFLYATT